MFLRSLVIKKGEAVIRSIPFHMGLNLIVDETISCEGQESGNNVGKTTVLKLIDFCLGSDGENIYLEDEFKGKANAQVEAFVKRADFEVCLTLTRDLDSTMDDIIIRRNFLERSAKVFEINGEKQTLKSFPAKLKSLVFRSDDEKPTWKQLVAKNIRYEKERLTNTLKVLSPYTRTEEYEALYLFWLGVDVDINARKQKKIRERTQERNLMNRLKKVTSYSQINQSLIIVDRDIKDLSEKRASIGDGEDYNETLNRFVEVKSLIQKFSRVITRLELRKQLILESRDALRQEVSQVDLSHVRSVYEQAKAYVPNLQRTFEETVVFHNQMVQSKLRFVSVELPELETELKEQRDQLEAALAEQEALTLQLDRLGYYGDVRELDRKLNSAFETKGSLESQKKLWDETQDKLDVLEEEIDEINKGIYSKDDLIQQQITEFNRYFSLLSKQLYGEQFVLSSDKKEKGYTLEISSISGNLGTGKKKGQIAAFDLAYIQFADSREIECLHFILQDQIENVHDNQLSSILTKLVSQTNCQYILPVLRDKLPPDIDVDSHQIVSLSQKDKLFRI